MINEKMKLSERSDILPTLEIKVLPLGGSNNTFKVVNIPIQLLKYNINNGRISSETFLCSIENLTEDKISDLIKNSNMESFKKTKENIKEYGQLETGVVSNDGKVIDGNRRFTCLRDLHLEFPNDDRFKCFKAVILDSEKSKDDKLIKSLELKIQHRKDKEVDYDPINKILDAYNWIEIKKEFSAKEYADSYGMKEKDILNWLYQAEIINEFLEWIGHKGEWLVAKDKKWQGPINEISNYLSKQTDNILKNKHKKILYAGLVSKKSGDITRDIRDLAKIINTNDINEVHNSADKIWEKIYNVKSNIENLDKHNITYIQSELSDDFAIFSDHVDSLKNRNINTTIKTKPIKILGKIYNDFNDIDTDIVSRLPINEKNEINKLISEIGIVMNKIKESTE